MEVYILTEEQLFAYKKWVEKVVESDYGYTESTAIPPLPNMVTIWDDEQIEIYNGVGVVGSIRDTEKWIEGAKFMRDKIIGK